MTPREKDDIRQALNGIGREIRIRMHAAGDARGQAIREFCETLQSLCPEVRISEEKSETGVSFFEISDNVIYQAVPLGVELSPFLAFLSGSGTSAVSGLPDREILDQIKVPASLTIFIAPQCPHCPQAVAGLLTLAGHCSRVHVRVVDAEMFSQTAADAKVRSAPTTILDKDFRWTGTADLREIVDAIIHRDPARLRPETLQQMIEEKTPEVISRMMIESRQVYPGFIDLLIHEKWSVRLGAMVVFEYMNAADGPLAMKTLDAIWERFESVGDDVKGDILYLSGESKRLEMMDRLTAVCDGSYSESVREAAREAIEAVEE